jgi:hypothetical protein
MSFAPTRLGACGGLRTSHQPLRAQPSRQPSRCPARQIAVQAKKGVPDPPDTPKQERRGGREWMQTMLARFGPIPALQVRKVAEDNGVDVSEQIKELEGRAAQVRGCGAIGVSLRRLERTAQITCADHLPKVKA